MKAGLPLVCLGAALLLLGALFTPAHAQGVRIHMHAEEGYAADGVLFTPSGQPPFAAIVLIPDEQGLTQHVTDAAAAFAAAGYLAVAVDLNRGLSPAAATHSDAQTQHDLGAAITFLSQQETVRPHVVAALGWGSGGAAALWLAAHAQVRAVAIVDTAWPSDPAVIAAVHTPVLGSFGGHDPQTSRGAIKSLAEHEHALGAFAGIKVYEDASAGFDDPQDAAHYRKNDAEDLQRRTLEFFAAQLAKPP